MTDLRVLRQYVLGVNNRPLAFNTAIPPEDIVELLSDLSCGGDLTTDQALRWMKVFILTLNVVKLEEKSKASQEENATERKPGKATSSSYSSRRPFSTPSVLDLAFDGFVFLASQHELLQANFFSLIGTEPRLLDRAVEQILSKPRIADAILNKTVAHHLVLLFFFTLDARTYKYIPAILSQGIVPAVVLDLPRFTRKISRILLQSSRKQCHEMIDAFVAVLPHIGRKQSANSMRKGLENIITASQGCPCDEVHRVRLQQALFVCNPSVYEELDPSCRFFARYSLSCDGFPIGIEQLLTRFHSVCAHPHISDKRSWDEPASLGKVLGNSFQDVKTKLPGINRMWRVQEAFHRIQLQKERRKQRTLQTRNAQVYHREGQVAHPTSQIWQRNTQSVIDSINLEVDAIHRDIMRLHPKSLEYKEYINLKKASSTDDMDSEIGTGKHSSKRDNEILFLLKPMNSETATGQDDDDDETSSDDSAGSDDSSSSSSSSKSKSSSHLPPKEEYPLLNKLLGELSSDELSSLTDISKRYVDVVRDIISTLDVSSANISIAVENMKSISEKLYTQDLELKSIVYQKPHYVSSPALVSPGAPKSKETRSRVSMQKEARCLERIKLTLSVIHCYRVIVSKLYEETEVKVSQFVQRLEKIIKIYQDIVNANYNRGKDPMEDVDLFEGFSLQSIAVVRAPQREESGMSSVFTVTGGTTPNVRDEFDDEILPPGEFEHDFDMSNREARSASLHYM